MSRRVLLLLLLVVVVVVGAGVALVATTRPDLEERRDAVDARWAAVRPPLVARYDGLAQLADALAAAGAGERTYTVDLAAGLGTWQELAAGSGSDPGAEVAAANRLEGLATRTRVNVAASARLSRDPGVTAALAAFDTALVPADEVGAYNRAVRRYQTVRTDTVSGLSADVLGYGDRPILVVGPSEPTG